MRKIIPFLIAAIFVSGCKSIALENGTDLSESPTGSQISSDQKLYEDKSGFSLIVPKSMQEFVGIELDNNPKNVVGIENYYLDVKDVLENTLCDKSSMGASEIDDISKSGTKILWGRVDFWDRSYQDGAEPPSDETKIICKDEINRPPRATYVLCSQKAERTVFVCMGQEKDNSKIARQIFETFKWTN